MKKILLILLLCSCAFATQQSLSGNASGWTVAATDTIILNGNAVIDNVTITCVAFWMPAGQTYTLSESGTSTLILSGNGIAFKDSTSGTKTYPDSIAILGSGLMTISSGSGAITATSTKISFSGTDTVKDNKGLTLSSYYIGDRDTLVNNGTATTTLTSGNPLTFVNGGYIRTTRRIFLSLTTTGNFYTVLSGAPVWIQDDASYCYLNCVATGITATLQTLTFAGGGGIYIRDNLNANCTILLGGNIVTGTTFGWITTIAPNATSGIFKFKTQNYNITTGTLSFGPSYTSGTPTDSFDFGSSIISANNISNSGQNKAGILNFSSAKFIVAGNIVFAAIPTVVPGTSKISTTGTCSFTSAGKAVYDLTDSLGALTFADSATILDDFTSLSGNSSNLTWGGYGMYCGGDLSLNNTGTINMGNSVNFPNASSLLSIASGTGAITATSCNIYSAGASFTTAINKYVRFKNAVFTAKSDATIGGAFDSLRLNKIALADSAGIKVQATKKLVLDSLGDIEGSSGKLCRVQSTIAGSAFTLTMPTDTVSYVYFKDVTATNTIYALDGTSVDGGGNTNIDFGVDSIPVIDSIRPVNGIASTQIVLRGTTFGTAPDAYLNDSLLVYLFRNDTSYTFALPDRGLFGTVAIKIKNNVYNTFDTVSFFIFYKPVLASVSPDHGRNAGGDTISFRGDTLGAVDTVWFLNDPAIPFLVTDSIVKCLSPAHAPGTILIAVHDTNGYSDTLLDAFEYNNLYGWTVTHPASLDTAGGDTMYFRSEYGQATVPAVLIFDGNVVLLTTNTDTLSTYITPAHAKGSVAWSFDAAGTVKTGNVFYGRLNNFRQSIRHFILGE